MSSNHVPPPYESVDDILRELEAIDEERLHYYKEWERLKEVVSKQEKEIARLVDKVLDCLRHQAR